MKLLYANDNPGEHAASWYAATSNADHRAALVGNRTADVCIVGAGFTGLSAAIELGRQGKRVIVLEAHRVGWGASGRNGGQLGSGFNIDQMAMERLVGKSRAQSLWAIAESGKQWIQSLCHDTQLDIEYQSGIIHASHRKRFVNGLHEYCDYLASNYGYSSLEPLDKATVRQRVQSDAYSGGAIDHGAAHIHSLKLAHGMAQAAESAGVKIFEMSEVVRLQRCGGLLKNRAITAGGSIQCQHMIIAVNGYLDALHQPLQKMQMPINNFILVTEPLGERATELLPFNNAVADSRFVVNYYRRVDGDRLLFGGGESYGYRFPRQIGSVVRRNMLAVFPQLHDVHTAYTWGGTLAITRNRLPHVTQIEPQIYSSAGYSGHGVGLACACGVAVARHICGDVLDFNTLSSLPITAFPGGNRSRPVLLTSAMIFYSLLDRL